MSTDGKIRALERQVLQGDGRALERLKREWLRTTAWQECFVCGAQVPCESYEEHKKTHAFTAGGRPRKGPIWSWVPVPASAEASINFFRPWSPEGSRGSLLGADRIPAGSVFCAYGLSLVPDTESTNSALKVWNRGVLQFAGADRILADLPCREVMDDPNDWPSEDDGVLSGLRRRRPVRSITVAGRPYVLDPGTRIQARLDVPVPLHERTGMLFALYGMWVPVKTSTSGQVGGGDMSVHEECPAGCEGQVTFTVIGDNDLSADVRVGYRCEDCGEVFER